MANNNNGVVRLIELIQGSIQHSTELTIEVRTLLNSALNTLNNYSAKDIKIEGILQQVQTNLALVIEKVSQIEKTDTNEIKELFMTVFGEMATKDKDNLELCNSHDCPKEKSVEDKNKQIEDIQKDKNRILENHETDKKWWRKKLWILMIICIFEAIELGLYAAMGKEGIVLLFDLILKIVGRK